MDIKDLLVALDDTRVQKKIMTLLGNSFQNSAFYLEKDAKEIVSQKFSDEKLEKRDSTIQSLSAELEELKLIVHEKDLLIREYQEQENRCTELENKNIQVEERFHLYQNSFKDDLLIKELYEALSDKTKLSISGIFKSESIQGLVVCGCQENNIMNLWDYIKNQIINNVLNEEVEIIRIFELLFKRYRLAYPMFAYQSVQVGDEFDNQQHIRHNLSKNISGSIKQILLSGVVNEKSGKVIKQAIVIV